MFSLQLCPQITFTHLEKIDITYVGRTDYFAERFDYFVERADN